jgi:serine/threonine protein kinase/tetratricopeptide (TPR) repeat protein
MATLSPERWLAISPYLDKALSLTERERGPWLELLRSEKPDVADLIAKLLQEHRAAAEEGFLEGQPPHPAESSGSGQNIGPYTLISLLGQGGMGSVWLAERSDGRFERRFAIKFLRFSLTTGSDAERFKREGKILGQLSHPHIAELIDAGITQNGEPYLVLEHVDGDPLDEYCDRHSLNIESRIKLFLDVLGAVAHAHASLIVHRDLKPSNVLVRNDGQVKLLDFGIAKLLADDTGAAEATLLTLEAGTALTPQFAAPEQITAAPITTATDVYALGVLLYLLLTGCHPTGQRTSSAAALVKAIVDLEPPRITEAVSNASSTEFADKRSTTSDKLKRQLRGDLETIVSKALKKNPAERYGSVNALAGDLERYLKHEPISARPDSFTYRAGRFVRRNRMAVSLTALALIAVIAGTVGTLVQARTARRQRDQALHERDRARRIAEFTVGMFKVSDPGERVGNAVTARQVLDKASQDVAVSLAKDPDLQAQMMHVMGKAYSNLGLHQRAQSLFESSIRAGQSAAGPNNPETLSTMRDLAWSLFQQGRLEDAEKLQRQVLDSELRVLGPQSLETVDNQGNLAAMLDDKGEHAEAEKLNREVLEAKRRLLGPQSRQTLAAMDNLAINLARSGKLAEAEKLEKDTLAIELRVFGRENLGTISSMINLAAMNMDLGNDDEAEKEFREALQLEKHILGPDQPETALTAYNLAEILARRGQTDEALSLIGQAVDHGLHPRIDLKIEKEPNFASLHRDPRFATLVARAKQRAAALSSD